MELWNEGYVPYATTESQMEAVLVDASFAECVCPKCGGWMYYEGWFKADSYRAFSVCDNCEYEEEF